MTILFFNEFFLLKTLDKSFIIYYNITMIIKLINYIYDYSIANRQSPIANRQSPIANRQRQILNFKDYFTKNQLIFILILFIYTKILTFIIIPIHLALTILILKIRINYHEKNN